MIAQYAAASLVSQNKQLCTPASVDSIVSSNGQEDHVSMGANSATKLYKIIQNLENILAIEWLCGAQAIDLKRPLTTSTILESLLLKFRETVPFMENDRIISDDFKKTVAFYKNQEWERIV
jgi:histidine ammonia-lyase